jgi:Ca-activated chloride channel family protein
MFTFRFEHIEFLGGLLALPLLVILFAGVLRWKKMVRKKIGDPALVSGLTKSYSPAAFLLKFVVVLTGFALVVLAAANLQRPGPADHISRKGVDVIVALDVSNSMLAEDVKPSRLARAKQFITRLTDKLDNDRVGLVLFAGRAYLQMPLTTDQGATAMYVQNAGPDAVPSQGTVIGQALKLSATCFNPQERKYKAIVLISDGEDHDPEALKVAKELVTEGVMINTVGIGSPEGSPIIDNSTHEARKDAAGNMVITKLNEPELQQLATETNGLYVRLDDPDDAAAKISSQLAKMDKTTTGDKSFAGFKSYFQWFLALAFILLLLEIFLSEKKIQRS